MHSPRYRTAALAVPLALLSALLGGCGGSSKPAHTTAATSPTPAFTQIEHRFHARLGLYALDTGTGRTVAYRADDRFAYASTMKAFSTGVLLKRSTNGQLNHVITYRASDLVDYSPITSKHVGTGMKLRDIMAAAMEYSDNTAANLLLNQLGGPKGLQTALRGLGDATTDVDRNEPTVNTAIPGDTRDTSTARVLGIDLRRFVLGGVLPRPRRRLLTNWLVGNTTGGPYIRAGVPSGWKVGDKTGNADYGTRNDIAIVWPTGGSPIIISVLSDRGVANASSDDALIADATKAAVAMLR